MNIWAWGIAFWIGYHLAPRITSAVAAVWILHELGAIA